jgi:hypothetical protein
MDGTLYCQSVHRTRIPDFTAQSTQYCSAVMHGATNRREGGPSQNFLSQCVESHCSKLNDRPSSAPFSCSKATTLASAILNQHASPAILALQGWQKPNQLLRDTVPGTERPKRCRKFELSSFILIERSETFTVDSLLYCAAYSYAASCFTDPAA